MAEGRTNRGIGAELTLSESSVEKYVNAIFSKLGLSAEPQVHRRVAAVLTFLRDGERDGGMRPPLGLPPVESPPEGAYRSRTA